jgi:glyoxylase-like metal-dependent hydrolase (beta-lactamase superfamily II)
VGTLFTGDDRAVHMAQGDLREATAGASDDIYYVDTGTYGTPNYGTVYILDADRPALVDTGIGKRYDLVLDAMDEVGIAPADLDSIVPTHVHLDHAGGTGYLAEACPGADVYVHEVGARHLVEPAALWQGTKAAVGDLLEHYAEPEPVPEDRIVELTDGDDLDLGDRLLDVHHVPGHAPHQVALYDPAADGVFTADAAGSYAPGLDAPYPETPPPSFDLGQCLADVARLRDLDPAALYLGHFGDWEADGFLTETADALEAWVADVESARERFDDDAVVDHFVERVGTEVRPDSADVWGEATARSKMAMNVHGVLGYLDD